MVVYIRPFLIHVIACCLLNLTSSMLHAQGIFNPAGADVWGRAGVSSVGKQQFSGLQNPALLTHHSQWGVAMNADQRYGTRENTTAAISGHYPVKGFVVSAHLLHYGYHLFNQQRIGIAASKKLSQQVALGVSLDYTGTFISEYGNAGNLIPTIGISYQPMSNLEIGFSLFNPAQASYGRHTQESVPTWARLGMTYSFSEKVAVFTEIQQNLTEPVVLRGAVRYFPVKQLYVSVGASSNPAQYTAGVGMQLKHLSVYATAVIHEVLGLAPQIGISYPAW